MACGLRVSELCALCVDDVKLTARPPRVLVCIPWREYLVAPMFRQNWIVATDSAEADFVIETERSHCAHGGEIIDEVRRFDRPFAWTVAKPSARE